MTYNPRIKNRRNNRLQVTGSALTGSVADFAVVSGSIITGSSALFDQITVNTINITNPVQSTASYALDADKLDGFTSGDFVKVSELSTSAVTSLSGGTGITVSSATGAVTASVDTAVVVTVASTQTISGQKTFTSALSGTTAEFTNVTASLLGNVVGTASHATTAGDASTLDGLDSTAFVQSANLANAAVTSLSAGNGLTGTDTTGSVTLAVGQGTGIVVDADTVSIDTSAVVTITGSQTISGAKTLTANLSGTTAQFTEITASVIKDASLLQYNNPSAVIDAVNEYTFIQSNQVGGAAIYQYAPSGAIVLQTEYADNQALQLSAFNGSVKINASGNIFIGNDIGSDGPGNVIVNYDGKDADFQVKGDTDENLLFVNGGTDQVGIGTNSPSHKLDVNGTLGVSGASTLAAVSGTTAQFTSITGTLSGDITGNAATVTNGVYTNTISSVAVTAITAGDGLSVTGTVGTVTLNVGAGDGISVAADSVAVDSTVVRTSGDQTIGGVKTLTSPLTGTTAYFSGDVVINGTASIAQLNTVNQTSLVVGDKYITILSGGVDHTGIDGAGFLWGTSSGPSESTGSLGEHAHILYDSTLDVLSIFPGLNVEGHSKLQTVSGTTGQLTVLTASLASLGTAVATSVAATSVTADSLSTNVTGVTANFNLGSLTGKHIILVDCSSSGPSDITGTLPLAAAAPYKQFIFKKTDSTEFALVVSASGGETIDGDSKVEIVTQHETLTIVSDGVNKWFIV